MALTCTLGRTKVYQDLIQMVLIQLYCLTQYALQRLASFLVQTEFGFIISQKKTEIMSQNVDKNFNISIAARILNLVNELTFLKSTIFSNLFFDSVFNKLIEKFVQ